MFDFDPVEKRLIRGILIAFSLWLFSLFCTFAFAEENISTYTNGQNAIRGECNKEVYYLTWTESIQEGYQTRYNYYCLSWSDPRCYEEYGILYANDLKFYRWSYTNQRLYKHELDSFDLVDVYGKTDIYSNSSLFGYPSIYNLNMPIVKIHETWIQIFFIVFAIFIGIKLLCNITSGQS